MGFREYMEKHSDELKNISRQILVDVYGIAVNKLVPLRIDERQMLSRIIKEPDVNWIFEARIPDGVGKTKDVWLKAINTEDDLFLECAFIEDGSKYIDPNGEG